MSFKEFSSKVVNGISGILIENGKLSIGRTMLLATFGLAIGKWSIGLDIPSTHINVLMAMLAYVLGSKVVGNVSDTINKIQDAKKIVTNTFNEFKSGNTTVSNITNALTDLSNIAQEVQDINSEVSDDISGNN